MSNMLQKLLGMSGAVAKRGTTKAAKTSKELVEQLAEEGPEVIGKGTSRAKKAADDISDAAFTEVTPTTGMDDMSWINRMDPRLQKFAKGAGVIGAGGLGYSLMSDDEQPEIKVPLAPEPIKPVEAKKPEELKAEVKKTVKTEAPKPDGLDFDALGKKLDEEMANLPQDNGMSDDNIMREALERESQNRFMSTLLRASTQAGSAIAGGSANQIKPDYSGVEALEKNASSPVNMVKTLMDTESKTLSKQKLQAELNDDVAMRDPNSEISKMVTGIAQQVGILKPGTKTSAMDLKNSGVNLGTLLATIEAGKARKEAAQLAREAAIKAKETKLSNEQRKFAQGLRKEATTGVLGKQYATYSTGQRMSSALADFAQNPSGYKDYATLMGGLKSLQGDESVVREAEVRLGMSATSAIDAVYNQLQKMATGKMLNDAQRKEMINTIQTLTDASKTQYMHSVAPILEQAEMEGIDPELILAGSLSGAKPATVENNNSGMVKVLPPGGTKPKMIPRSQLDAAIQAGGKLVE